MFDPKRCFFHYRSIFFQPLIGRWERQVRLNDKSGQQNYACTPCGFSTFPLCGCLDRCPLGIMRDVHYGWALAFDFSIFIAS